MRRIAIIGAGQAGLHLGIGLVDAGYAVTLFSDRTPEAILNGKPMGLPLLFPDALQLERNLGINFWDDEFLGCDRFRNHVCDPEGNVVLSVSSNLEQRWQSVDQRLKFFTWMHEFVNRGGELVIKAMTPQDLEECVQKYDLVVVAVGRGSFSTLFEKDAQKTKHHQPKRHIAGGLYTGLNKGEAIDYRTFRVTNLPGIGEMMQAPFYAKDKLPVYAVAFEAYPGGVMDQFSQVKSGQELLEISKKVIKQLRPCDYEIVKDMELVDDQAWVQGAITPIVRQPVGHLPSGAIVMGIGDAVILHDPIAAQGANNATKMAHLVKQRIIEHGNQRFDQSWMQGVFDEFWNYAQYTHTLTDCLLTPPDHMQELMAAMAQNREVLKDYLNGMNHPPTLAAWFDAESSKKYLASKTLVLK
ncbi:styrene monooxygenase/indole monooxygenase family protein [Pelatocladus sp. BLCC-F211]|uniref:styrene monooxygenase/indole monooxygenase family protein n=1 Tax=Pelatocladus sp. BLCC-F211 TaxID=3342752 RepID=UPI0035B85787